MRLAKEHRSVLIGIIAAVMLMCLISSVVYSTVSRRSDISFVANSSVAAGGAPASSVEQKPLSQAELFGQRYHKVTGASGVPALDTTGSSLAKGRMTLTFRAISLNRSMHDPAANQIVAREVLSQIQGSPRFDRATGFTGELSEEQSPGTFTFTIAAALKKPLEL